MKKTVLVLLVAALAACGSKKTGSDCDAAIGKGIENFTKGIKEHAPNPQVVERMMGMMDKLKGVLVERCKADNWSPEAVTCFTTVNNRKDMQGCQNKLTPEQSSKLTGEISQVMMSQGGMGQRMPPGMAGHPETLQGNGSAAPGAPGAAGGSADPAAAPAATPPPSPPAGAEGSAAAPAAGSAAK